MLHGSNHRFISWDGVQLSYRAWMSSHAQPRRAMIMLHAEGFNADGWQSLAGEMVSADLAVFAWDARGHGHSPGIRGYISHTAILIKDLDAFMRHLTTKFQFDKENSVVMGQGFFGVVACAWCYIHAPRIRALMLVDPTFTFPASLRWLLPLGKWLHKRKMNDDLPRWIWKKTTIGSGVRYTELSSRVSSGETAAVSFKLALGIRKLGRRLLHCAKFIDVPVLLLHSAQSGMRTQQNLACFFYHLSSPLKEMRQLVTVIPAFPKDAAKGGNGDMIKTFLKRVFSMPYEELVYAGVYSQRMPKPMSVPHEFWYDLPLKRFYFALLWILTHSVGRLSQGIRLGISAGIGSGVTLDYVIQNQAQGFTFLGRWLDRLFLNLGIWQCLRMRKQHIEKLLKGLAKRVQFEGKVIQILDISTGQEGYLLSAIKSLQNLPIKALFLDDSLLNVLHGNALMKQQGLDQVSFQVGNITDKEFLGNISPKPTIVVISGFFETMDNNSQVGLSLEGVHQCMQEGGYLIYTQALWHPRMEWLTRLMGQSILLNNKCAPYLKRQQAAMDRMVKASGFEKIAMDVDNQGIYTVSVALKPMRQAFQWPLKPWEMAIPR